MKNLSAIITLLCMLWTLSTEAQVKKIPLVEHFSNTPCPICQSSRSGIYSDLAQFEGKVNHITVHRGYPYESCVLYQYNKSESDARVAIHENSKSPLSGTPVLCVNGVSGGYRNLDTKIEAALEDSEVRVGLNMKEEGNQTRKATLEVANLTDSPMGNLYVYAALVEESVNVDGDNIHDVFRKFLGNEGGDGNAVGTLAAGTTKEIILEGSVPNDLSSNNIYVVAWVENRVPDGDSYQIVTENSVSEKSSLLTSNNLELTETELMIHPNPASRYLNISNSSSFTPQTVKIFNISGKQIKSLPYSGRLSIEDLSPGSYIIMLEDEGQRVARKFIKQ